MNRSIHQYRPKGDPGAMPYSPQRDLANIYTPMLKEVFLGLDQANWAPHIKAWFEREGIDEAAVGQAVTVLVEAHRLFIRDRSVTSPADAFEKAGAGDLPDAVRVALFERIGEVLMGGFFIAIRDVTMQGHESPGATDFAEMIAAGREMAKRFSGHEPQDVDIEMERLRAEAEETTRTLGQAHGMLEDEKRRAFQAESERNGLAMRIEKLTDLLGYLAMVKQAGWFRRAYYVVRLAWRLYWRLRV